MNEETIYFPRKTHPLWTGGDMDLYVRYMSFFKSSEHFINGGGTNNAIVFHIVTEGEGVIHYGSEDYKVEKGKMFVMWPNVFVRYEGGPWWYKWIWLAGTKAKWALNQAGITEINHFFDISDCENFADCIDGIEDTFLNKEYSSFYPVRAGWEIIDALEKDMLKAQNIGNTGDIANMCRILIDNRFESLSSVNDLAAYFKIDRTTLFRLFKESFNVSPKEYIEKVRFEKACQLLSMTDMKIKEISSQCGYENQCYFSSAFQKRFGCSPKEWKKKL